MVNIIGINRINALGLVGPENAAQKILENFPHKKLLTENQNIEEDEKQIFELAKKELNEGIPFFIGGDHSNLYPIGKAFKEKYKENSFLIVFDAHADCMYPMKEPTHEEVISGLVNYGWDPEKILMIGLRKVEPEEEEYLENNSILTFSPKDNLKEIYKKILSLTKEKKVYLSIDTDAIDPIEFPAVNYPEENGIKTKEFFGILEKIKKNLDLKCIDLVEFVPGKDVEGKSLNVARKIVKLVSRLL